MNHIKGLTSFTGNIQKKINDDARVQKVVDDELKKITKGLRGSKAKPSDARKHVAKALFISSLGYDVTVGQEIWLDMLAGSSVLNALVAFGGLYLPTFHPGKYESRIRDALTGHINSGDAIRASLAFRGVACITEANILTSLAPAVTEVCATAPDINSLLAAANLLRANASGLNHEKLAETAVDAIKVHNASLVRGAIEVCFAMLERNKSALDPYVSSMSTYCLSALDKIISSDTKITDLHQGVPRAWLQSSLCSLAKHFPPPKEDYQQLLLRVVRATIHLVDELLNNPKRTLRQFGRCSVMIADAFEAASLGALLGYPKVVSFGCEFTELLMSAQASVDYCSQGMKLLPRLLLYSGDLESARTVDYVFTTLLEILREQDPSLVEGAINALKFTAYKETAPRIVAELREHVFGSYRLGPNTYACALSAICFLAKKCPDVLEKDVIDKALEEAGKEAVHVLFPEEASPSEAMEKVRAGALPVDPLETPSTFWEYKCYQRHIGQKPNLKADDREIIGPGTTTNVKGSTSQTYRDVFQGNLDRSQQEEETPKPRHLLRGSALHTQPLPNRYNPQRQERQYESNIEVTSSAPTPSQIKEMQARAEAGDTMDFENSFLAGASPKTPFNYDAPRQSSERLPPRRVSAGTLMLKPIEQLFETNKFLLLRDEAYKLETTAVREKGKVTFHCILSNRSGAAFSSISLSHENPTSELSVKVDKIDVVGLEANAELNFDIRVRCIAPFDETPSLRIATPEFGEKLVPLPVSTASFLQPSEMTYKEAWAKWIDPTLGNKELAGAVNLGVKTQRRSFKIPVAVDALLKLMNFYPVQQGPANAQTILAAAEFEAKLHESEFCFIRIRIPASGTTISAEVAGTTSTLVRSMVDVFRDFAGQ